MSISTVVLVPKNTKLMLSSVRIGNSDSRQTLVLLCVLLCCSQGGKLSIAYSGNPLPSIAKVKEQIMLNGGVTTSMALSLPDFQRFTNYKEGVFSAMGELHSGVEGIMHAVFCFGWWDSPQSSSDGYWLCKNRYASVTHHGEQLWKLQ
jgi:hypothetical protein